MWIALAVASAFFLGLYDVFKKHSLNGNAILPTLFFSTVTASVIMLCLLALSRLHVFSEAHLAYIPHLSWQGHLKIGLKTVIVLLSWTASYYALKHLPLTVFSPIRATGPLWVTLGAMLFFSERLATLQIFGGILILAGFILFSSTGKNEDQAKGIKKAIWLLIFSILLNSASALYDRYLIWELEVMAVQAYFTFYQTVILAPILAFIWYPQRQKSTPFQWRWSIPLIGVALLIGDFFYFFCLSIPGSLLSIVFLIRSSSVIIAFLYGALFFKEKNLGKKSLYLFGILLGLLLLIVGH